jgi:hypothetical protein
LNQLAEIEEAERQKKLESIQNTLNSIDDRQEAEKQQNEYIEKQQRLSSATQPPPTPQLEQHEKNEQLSVELQQRQAELAAREQLHQEMVEKFKADMDSARMRASELEAREAALANKEYKLQQQEELQQQQQQQQQQASNTAHGSNAAAAAAAAGASLASQQAIETLTQQVSSLRDFVLAKFELQEQADKRIEQDIDDVQTVVHSLPDILAHKKDIEVLQSGLLGELQRVIEALNNLYVFASTLW